MKRAFAMIGAVAGLALAGCGSENTDERVADAIEKGGETCPDLAVDDLGGGLTAKSFGGKGFVEAVNEEFAAQGPPFDSIQTDPQGLVIRRGKTNLAFVIAVPIDPGVIEEEGGDEVFAEDVVAGAAAENDTLSSETTTEVAGRPTLRATRRNQTQYISTTGCHMVILSSGDQQSGDLALSALIEAQ